MALLNIFATVALVNAIVDPDVTEDAGMVILEPSLGFATAYGIGEPVWNSRAFSRSILVFVTGSTDTLECFGPDANDELVSLGTLDAGWTLLQGDLGSSGGAARIYST